MSPQNRFSKLSLVLGVMLLFVLTAMRSSLIRVAPAQPLPALGPEDQEHAGIQGKRPRPDHPDEAARFRRLQTQDEKGFIPPDGLEKARRHVESMKQAQRERIKRGIAPQSAGIKPDSWTWMGPGNVGGRIRAIVIQPTNANNMWIGSVSGGIWRTTDAGGNWQPVGDFMANLAVSTMVINPTNSNIMYAGTGESFYNNLEPSSIQGAGVFRSTNGGVTWNQLPLTNPGDPVVCGSPSTCPWLFVNRLAISPNGNTILAATGNSIQWSTDSGMNWTQAGGVAQTVLDIDFHPTDNQRAVASGYGSTVFSTDGGQNWTLANFTPTISGRVELAYAPSNPTTVYASVDQNNGDIYRSTDGGQNFTRVNTGTNFFLSAGNSQGGYDNIIWVNPQDATFVIVGGVDLWRSTNSAQTFTQISDWQCAPQTPAPRNPNTCPDTSVISAHADHHMIVAHPGFNNNTNRTVFFSNDGGIFRTDNVATVAQTNGWIELNNNLGITQFYGGAGNAASGVIIGGTQDNGTLRFSGNTEGWTFMFGGDGGYSASDPSNSNFFYGEFVYLQINRSTNGGVSASRIDAGIGDANNQNTANFIAPFILDPNDPDTMLAGGRSLWRSTDVKDATPTWTAIKAPTAGNSPISAIAVSPIGSNVICVGHNNGDIFLTFNGTAGTPVWTKIDTVGLPNRFVTRLVIDSSRSPSSWIYATFGGFSPDNVNRTADLGTTWTDITGAGPTGLPNVPVRSLVYHPRFRNFLYVGTEVGIFTSEDAGATWELPQGGPANVSVDELFWLVEDQLLIAATHGRGLYRASGGIYVDCNRIGFELGTFDAPFRTIAAAVNATTRYQTIWIKPCNYNEQITINRRLELRSLGGTAVIGRP